MKKDKYSFEQLRQNTTSIRLRASELLTDHRSFIDKSFEEFSDYVDALEQQPVSLERNIKMILAAKLLNHVYSGLILSET